MKRSLDRRAIEIADTLIGRDCKQALSRASLMRDEATSRENTVEIDLLILACAVIASRVNIVRQLGLSPMAST